MQVAQQSTQVTPLVARGEAARGRGRLASVPAPADIDAIRAATKRLAGRFTGGDGTTGIFCVDLGRAGRLTLEIGAASCIVRHEATMDATARIRTDPTTWLGVCDGSVDPIRAFLDGRLLASGDLHAAVRLEALFAPTSMSRRTTKAMRTRTSRSVEVASLVAGSGTPVLLLHGLAANMLTFLPTFVELADRHEVHMLDLPGFGTSSKPTPRGERYHPSWMAEHVRRYIETHGLEQVHVIGNSMGGRIAHELALQHPDVVRSVTALCPAVAFDHFQRMRPLILGSRFHWAGVAPVRVPLSAVERAMGELFDDVGRVPRQNIRAMAEDIVGAVRDRRYRLATAAAARHLGAEPAAGRLSYWRRIGDLDVPSLWIFGRQDVLVPGGYARRVRKVLPDAQVELWDACGHVPQYEWPERTHATIDRFVGRLDKADAAMRRIGAR